MTIALDSAKTMTPPPLHVALPGTLAEGVRRLAMRRGDHPQVLVAALMSKLVDDVARVDDLMGECVAAQEAPGQGRRVLDSFPQGLTQRQCGVIYVLGFHADEDGVFRKQLIKIGIILNGVEITSISDVLAALGRKGLVEQVRGREGKRHWQLTKLGRFVFKELSSEDEGA